MAFKTNRQHRYEYLREHGFLPFEAKAMSARLLKIPAIKEAVKDRMKIVRQSNKENWTQIKFRKAIALQYEAKNWTDKSGRKSIWKMSNYYDDLFKSKHPDYKSPAPKRKDFQADIRKYAK